jgi:predicted neuraminidase
MAASVDLSGPTAISVSPRALFDSGYVNLSHPDGNYFPYAVSADGQRFLIPRLVAPAAPATRVPADRKPYPDFALQAPVVNTAPGPEYAAWTRMFQNTPAIERTARGRLWAALVGGGANWGPLNYVVIVTSDDGGKSWSGPRLVVDPVDHVNATGPRLWRDPLQRLWLFWQQTYGRVDGRAGVWAIVSGNPDDASPAWSRPRRLADGNITGKPAVLSTGDWLAPVGVSVSPCDVPGINDEYRLGLTPSVIASLCHDLGDRKGTSVHRSTDQGQTWTWLGQARIPDVCCEHMVVERRDGSLWMLARTSYGIGQAISLDRGQSWVQTGESGIRHPVTKFFIERLKSGRLLLVRHNPPGALVRSHLTAYLSNDDGKSWTGALLLDERDNVSYPDGTEADDGTIHIIYDRGRTTDREILLATFKEEDVMRGTCVTTSCQLRRLVSKGGE